MLNPNTITSKLYASPILVVDDDPSSLVFIEKALRQRGFKTIYTAQSGEAALEHIRRLPPELVILDIAMPGLSGLDCCEWIRGQSHLKDLPVLMLTSLTNEAVRLQSFAAGATDFVSKPLHPDELFGRVNVHLLNRLSLKSLQRYKNRLDLELQNARDLQSAILPKVEDITLLREQQQLDITAHLNSCSEIGGDFWGMKILSAHQTSLWMVDFSGHGVAAALNAFRLQAYLNEHSDLCAQPGEYLTHLNEKLLHLLLRGHFATMFYGIIDTQTNRLNYACACNPHPLILKKNGKVKQLDGSGTPLGISPERYATQSVEFKMGDTLVLYSDALTETPDAQGKYIDEAAISTLLTAHKNASAHELKEVLLTNFQEHSSQDLNDDLTFCLCQRQEVTSKISHFQFSHPSEIYELAAQLSAYFPQRPDTLVGIHELLLNALEHGNLAIDKSHKRQLLQQGLFAQEMERLLADPANADKQVKISVQETDSANYLTIEDQGAGFDWKNYVGVVPDDASLTGRGLLMALRCGFDTLSFNAKGNAVTCIVKKQALTKQDFWES